MTIEPRDEWVDAVRYAVHARQIKTSGEAIPMSVSWAQNVLRAVPPLIERDVLQGKSFDAKVMAGQDDEITRLRHEAEDLRKHLDINVRARQKEAVRADEALVAARKLREVLKYHGYGDPQETVMQALAETAWLDDREVSST